MARSQVLLLAESLQSITAGFDALRIQRYRLRAQEDERRKRAALPPQHAGAPGGRTGWGAGWGGASTSGREKDQPAAAAFLGSAQQQQLLADENKSLVVRCMCAALLSSSCSWLGHVLSSAPRLTHSHLYPPPSL